MAAPTGGTLDALFTHAVQDAFSPTLQEWVDSHHGEIMDELRPMIRTWMDENLPQLIEAAVAREIGRISPGTQAANPFSRPPGILRKAVTGLAALSGFAMCFLLTQAGRASLLSAI